MDVVASTFTPLHRLSRGGGIAGVDARATVTISDGADHASHWPTLTVLDPDRKGAEEGRTTDDASHGNRA